MKKRLLSLLLALALLCALLPPTTFTARADDPVYSGTCGANLTWSFDPDTGALTIEGSGGMYNYEASYYSSSNNAPWLQFGTQITALSLPAGLTRIGDNAFYNCTGLTALTIPDLVSSIGENAFGDCTGLSAVTLSEGLTFIGEWAFSDCTGLTEVTIPNSVSTISDYAFARCTGLQRATILSPACKIGYSFPVSNNTFTICGYRYSSADAYARKYSVAFESLGDLEEIEGACGSEAFWRYVVADQKLIITGKGAMTEAPWRNLGMPITQLELPEGLTSIYAGAFLGCEFPQVTLPSSLKSIWDGAFRNCDALTEIQIPATVTEIGAKAFTGCDSLTKMIFQGDQVYIETAEFGTNWAGFEDTPEDLSRLETLGPKEQVVVYGPHTGRDGDYHEYGPDWEDGHTLYFDMCPRFFAETCGYTFYATDAFSDVKAGSWYEIPVAWAYGKGITGGIGEGRFGPNKKCTREQVMVFLWAANGSPEPESTVNPFKDVKKKDYYYKAVLWAVENGITGGIDDTHFGVGRVCDRAQVVTFLWAAAGSPEPETTENPFTDVKKKDYYYKAVLWAVENGITAGTTPTTFSPAKECTRAQVVTFLYAAYG